MRKPLATLAVLAAATAVLAACGDDNGGGSDSSVEADKGNGSGTAIEMQDFQFSPDSVDGTAGETITIELENTGNAEHTFTGEGVDEEVESGTTKTVEVTLPDSGTFDFFCRYHRNMGMTGTITTGAAAPSGGDQPAPDTSSGNGGYGGY